MDLLDWIVLALVALAALHGVRLGAAVQVCSFAGMLVGVVVGVVLVSNLGPHVAGQFARSFVSLLMLVVPCVVFWALGRQLGARVWGRLQGHSVARLDAAAGAAIAIAGTLVFVWLIASMMVSSGVPQISNEIQSSAIIRGVANVMPSAPNELASIENILAEDSFPVVIAPRVGPVKLPSSPEVAAAVRKDGSSTVKVSAYGCDNGYVVEQGSGFVVAGDMVVTNAHVVAGASRIVVRDEEGDHYAVPVYFDPDFDLAVLRVAGLEDPSLHLDAAYVSRGADAAVLGYPGGGPFNARPAGVLARIDAEGTDIYGSRSTLRWIYELQAIVRPGNSGGPLVEQDGEVVGVVFSRATDNSDVGYALASPGVLSRVHVAESRPATRRVSTGHCTAS